MPAPSDRQPARNDTAFDRAPLANRLLTAAEVAAFVGCHEESVRRAYLSGQLKRQRFGVRSCRFDPTQVRDWIAAALRRESYERYTGQCSGWAAGLVREQEGHMAVRKICRPKGCRGSPRCEHPWWST
jgi:hypothetical protein